MTAAFCACFLGAQAAWLPAAQAVAQEAPPATDAAPTHEKFIELEHRSAAEMTPKDKSLVEKKRREIAREADFFGYDLSSGNWDYDQVVCPDMPGELVLHYRSRSRTGAESLFTAVVPRGPGRVFVVPVLFRNATPFHSAVGSERSLSVFNQAVPEEIGEQAAQASGKWLELGMCYAAMVGAEPQVPQQPDTPTALVHAPVPTLQVSADHHSREIIFSDRNNPGQYMVWSIGMTDQGRVTAATARTFADYQAHTANGQNPPEKVIRPGEEPPAKVIIPGEEPPTRVPQQGSRCSGSRLTARVRVQPMKSTRTG